MYNKSTKFDENLCSHFWENENFKIFLMWTTINFEGRSKKKQRARDICKGTLDIEFERDWSFSLGATLAKYRKLKAIFLVSGIFPGKVDSVILLGFEFTIGPQNVIKSLKPFLRKWKF